MCEISCKNSEQLLRKWQETLGDTFFCRTLYMFISNKNTNLSEDKNFTKQHIVIHYQLLGLKLLFITYDV